MSDSCLCSLMQDSCSLLRLEEAHDWSSIWTSGCKPRDKEGAREGTLLTVAMEYQSTEAKNEPLRRNKNTCTHVFEKQHQSQRPDGGNNAWAHQDIKNNKSTQTTESYSVLKRRKILPSATVWMDLEGIV